DRRLLGRQLRDPDEVVAVALAARVELHARPGLVLRDRRELREAVELRRRWAVRGGGDRALPALRGGDGVDRARRRGRLGVDVDADPRLVVDDAAVVALGRPRRVRVLVDDRLRLGGVLAVAAERVEVLGAALAERDRLQARRRLDVARAGPALDPLVLGR